MFFSLQWGREKLLWESIGKAFKQTWVDNTTVTLEINDATEKDAGNYKCKFYGSWEPPKWKALIITVVQKGLYLITLFLYTDLLLLCICLFQYFKD